MRKQIKTLVNQDTEIIRPFILRDQGNVPPMLFFHFASIDERVSKEMNTTIQDDVIPVESGFYVPLTRGALMQQHDIFMDFMATVMATLTTMGITGALKSVVISATGHGTKIDTATQDPEGEAEIFIVSGVDSSGKGYTVAQELKARMGKGGIVYDLVDSDLLGEMNGRHESTLISAEFFKNYQRKLIEMPQDKKSLGILESAKTNYVDDPAQFTADLIEAAVHATVLFESMQQQK